MQGDKFKKMDRNASPGLRKPKGFTVVANSRQKNSMRTETNSIQGYAARQNLNQRLLEQPGKNSMSIPQWSNGVI